MTDKLNMIVDHPVFAGFLIDASGSMERYQQDVINGHKAMLATLRESEKCDKGVLYVYQCLFADQPRVLHGFYAMDRGGADKHIVALDTNNYVPNGMTALFDAIITMVQDLEAHLNQVAKQGLLPAARIAVITDGAENASKAKEDEVRAAIQRLRSKEWLQSSVIIGLTNPEFTEAKLEDLRVTVGFAQKIRLDRNAKDIRKAFALASKPKPDKN